MKRLLSIFFLLFPSLVLAASDSSLSFTPPESDYSVVFLGNLFGSVGGVLHGSGGQIIGVIFSVFNSAVLALGGIIIMYTLIVSTMNTAHEGQVLGQKWSSIWIPVRSTAGLALLIPKASGYCLMQVFVMWIVVQGVGAADKIWNAALDYLNKGGVIVKAEFTNPLSITGQPLDVAKGASVILSGQVCMLGLQTALRNQRENYMNMKQQKAGPCYGEPSGYMKTFCDNAVPDFLSSVNAVSKMNETSSSRLNTSGSQSGTSTETYQLNMPNFPADSSYSFLNGICGTIKWAGFSDQDYSNMQSVAGTSNLETIKMSRAIGIQAMYSTLQNVAQVMVNNDPKLQSNPKEDQSENYSPVAEEQFGIPYTLSGNVCSGNNEPANDPCVTWNPISTGSSESNRALFNGGEFMGAIQDYNGIMRPAMNLMNQYSSKSQDQDARLFIKSAEAQGWMMAGSYFFDLVRLNGSSAPSSTDFDQNSQMGESVFNTQQLLDAFGTTGQCQGDYIQLCYWFNKDSTKLDNLVNLINGNGLSSTPITLPPFSANVVKPIKTVGGQQASTTYGFITNSVCMTTPGQPGLETTYQLPTTLDVAIDTGRMRMPKAKFSCGRMNIIGCLGKLMGDVLYNDIFLTIYNFLLDTFQDMIESIVMGFISVPIQGMMLIFSQGLAILKIPGINPVIALADMGIAYINFAANLWLMLMFQAIAASILFIIGTFVFALLAMGMPLLIAWTGVMASIGFTTAYYVPLLPYTLFLFGVMAWLMAVVEAMVAGPIVALGITHPEGHDAFGKGESAIMILLNVFLRPSMMIIGYIVGISLSYITVWMLNAGFGHAISFMTDNLGTTGGTGKPKFTYEVKAGDFSDVIPETGLKDKPVTGNMVPEASASDYGIQYSNWAAIYAYFFSVLLYTSAYLVMVQKSFTLIANLPDRILRWLGSQSESYGGETAQWGDEMKGQVKDAGQASSKEQSNVQKQAVGNVAEAADALKGKAQGGSSRTDEFEASGGGGGGGGGGGAVSYTHLTLPTILRV